VPAKRRATQLHTCVVLLRGINLGARNRVAMEDLRALVGALGGEDVQTYVQSGNVVFRSSVPASDLVSTIERGIQRKLGLDVTVLLRTKGQLAQVVRENPFVGPGIAPTELHVTFLAHAPDPEHVAQLAERRFDPDRFAVAGQDVYLHCPNGYGRSKLSNAFFERRLAVPATTRNWKTVTTLATLASV
jgi:uncharacterized protein (DUF1697 family)